MSADIHILVDDATKERLLIHYPGRGELSNLVRRVLDIVVIQLENASKVDLDQAARIAVTDAERRGVGATRRHDRQDSETDD